MLIFCCLGVTIFAEESGAISPRFNNTVSTNTSFFIEGGIAYVNVGFTGFSGVTTGGQITTKIQKRFLLVFWNDVAEWNASSTEKYGLFSHIFDLNGSGMYRAKFTLTVTGNNGTVDTITDTIESEN